VYHLRRRISGVARLSQRRNSAILTLGLFLAALLAARADAADGPIQLKVIGGIAGVSQYTKLEAPFWQRDVPRLTQGRVQPDIHPFDQSGLSGLEMLQFMRLGVVPFGTALLAMVSADEPELNAVDLPLLNPEMASLRNTVDHYRGHLRQVLQRKYGIELLSIYAYPAQVIYCVDRFATLNDLAGRKIRTSSVSQSELMSTLGAIPVVTPFSEIVSAIKNHVVECAITGTMSGNQIGLPDVTSYIYPMAISWGLSFFGVNEAAWAQLPSDIQATLRAGIRELERTVWDSANAETVGGLACNIGARDCVGGNTFHMNLVPLTAADEGRRMQLLTGSTLPHWVQRCGNDCVTAWNETLGAPLGIRVSGE
jgi:TRAP-type C4-dicarboxylate transport system substrate-binding protein